MWPRDYSDINPYWSPFVHSRHSEVLRVHSWSHWDSVAPLLSGSPIYYSFRQEVFACLVFAYALPSSASGSAVLGNFEEGVEWQLEQTFTHFKDFNEISPIMAFLQRPESELLQSFFIWVTNICELVDVSSRGLPELAQNKIIYMNKNGKNYCFMKYIP